MYNHQMELAELQQQIANCYPSLGEFTIEIAHSFVHEVIAVNKPNGERYALKLYRSGVRSAEDIQWEVALHIHLMAQQVPIVELIRGTNSYFELLNVDNVERFVTLTKWAPGEKSNGTVENYRLMGHAAAQLHAACDSFQSDLNRKPLDINWVIEKPLALLRPLLESSDRWDSVRSIGDKCTEFVTTQNLDWGICHNDLTFDNVHVDGDRMTMFDLDLSAPTWRALEPAGVYQWACMSNFEFWTSWRDGYREVRDFSAINETAVPVLSLMYQFYNVAWKLGLTDTSVGLLLTPEELPAVADDWVKTFEALRLG